MCVDSARVPTPHYVPCILCSCYIVNMQSSLVVHALLCSHGGVCDKSCLASCLVGVRCRRVAHTFVPSVPCCDPAAVSTFVDALAPSMWAMHVAMYVACGQVRGGTCVVGLTLVTNGSRLPPSAVLWVGGWLCCWMAKLQLCAVDHSARVSMKSAANCVN